MQSSLPNPLCLHVLGLLLPLLDLDGTASLSLDASPEEFAGYDAGIHPWKNQDGVDRPVVPEHDAVSDVYFIRHGQNNANEFLAKYHTIFPMTPDYWDGPLTKLGVQQAAQAQEILQHKLGLDKVPGDSIQLAASLVSRAYDTLVIASTPLWRNWLSSGSQFLIHGVPAAMELDGTINSRRRAGVGEDDPVRWEDSVLGGDTSKLELESADAAKSVLFYQTAKDRDTASNSTHKPVQVQSFYSRKVSDFRKDQCDGGGLNNLADYLSHNAEAGKDHVVIAAHGALIFCMMARYGSEVNVPTSNGTSFFLMGKGLPNAAVLHVRMHRMPNRPIFLEPRFLHFVDTVTY